MDTDGAMDDLQERFTGVPAAVHESLSRCRQLRNDTQLGSVPGASSPGRDHSTVFPWTGPGERDCAG